MTSERPSPAGGSPLLEPLEPRLLLGGAPVPTVHPPILSWAGTNGFISDGVEPDVGFADTSYDFQLKYTDPDNQPPADGYPRVHILADGVDIAGSPLPMSPRTTATISSGRIYGVSTPDLPRGPSYQYFFEAMDTAGNLATGTPCVSPRPGPQVLNCPPRVDWRTDASCVQNGLYPQIRCPGFFTFWAIYTDRDNDPPEGGSPKVHVLKGGAEIAGSPFDMIPSDSPALGGPCRYKATILLLPPGDDYSYYFSAKDSWGASAGGEATSLQAGPEVVCDTQYGLVSASYGVFPDKIQVFWFDWAGPAVYEVWRGQSQLRAEAYRISPSDLTCTSFEDTTAEVGKKYYYFLKTTRADGKVYWSNDLNAWGLRGPEPHVIMLPDPARCVTGVSASHASFTDKVRVTWSPQEGAVAYEVWVTPHNHSQYGRVDLPDSTTLAAEVTGTSYDDTNVVRGEDYVYRVLVRREGDPPSSNGDRPYGGGTALWDEGAIAAADANSFPAIGNQTFGPLAESSPIGTVVGTVVATETDPDQVLTFGIVGGNTANAFAINDKTGELTVVNAAALDFETTPTFNLTVQVTDTGVHALSRHATVTISLVNSPKLTTIRPLTGAIDNRDLTITYADLAAASDAAEPDGSTIRYRIEEIASGTLTKGGADPTVAPGATLLGPGEFLTWHPSAHTYGTVRVFTVRAWNGQSASAWPVPVVVDVATVNEPPVALNSSLNVAMDGFVHFDLCGTDLETPVGDLVFTVSAPAFGTLMRLSGTGWCGYTSAGYLGHDSITFTVTDNGDPPGSLGNPGSLVSAPGVVSIVVGKQCVLASGRAARFTDESGDLVTVLLSGPGSGELLFAHGDRCDIGRLILTGTTERSSLSIVVTGTKATGMKTLVGRIDVQGSLGSLTGGAASLKGDMTVSGTLGRMTLGELTGGGTIKIGGTPTVKTGASLTFTRVKDTSLTSDMPLASLAATEWLDTGGPKETISAPRIGTLSIKGDALAKLSGDFGADVTLASTGATSALGTLSVAGWLTGATVSSAGSVGTVKVGGMCDSRLEAHDAGTQKSIGSFTVQGLAGQTAAFINSNVSGGTLGTVVLRDVRTNNVLNAGADFGVTGRKIASYTRWQGKAAAKKAANLVGAKVVEQVEDYILLLV